MSSFVGSRLMSGLLPPAKNNSKRIPVTTRGTHTHTLSFMLTRAKSVGEVPLYCSFRPWLVNRKMKESASTVWFNMGETETH